MPRLVRAACHSMLSCLALGCASVPERVEYGSIESQAEGRAMAYSVYTPPGWDGVTALPLVVFLHGGGDDETVLEQRANVVETFDEWIAAGQLDPFILVAPDGERGLWANWYDGSHRYEDYVVDDVIAAMRERYPIAAGRENLHLMGVSMGGAGAMYTMIHHRELFDSVTVLSAPLFDVDLSMRFLSGEFIHGLPIARAFGPPDLDRVTRDNPFSQLRREADLRGTKLLLGVGRADIPGLLLINRELHEHLDAHDVPHHYLEYAGGHGWRAWARLFPVALCLHMRGDACELDRDWFYTLERDPDVDALASSAERAGSL